MIGLQHRLPETRQGWIVAGFLGLALVFGGGGSPSAAAEIIVQLAFVAGVVAWVWWPDRQALVPPNGALLVLAGLLLGPPVLQLVPLPPAIWQALPGRELLAAAFASVEGAADRWWPLSVAPYNTLAALLALVPVVGALLASGMLAPRDRRFLLLVISLVSLAGAALGALQMAGGGHRFRLYEISHDLWLTAFHASRNSAADALLIGMLALTAWFASGSRRRPLLPSDLGLLALCQTFLFVALVLTGSRAGIALFVPVLLFQFAMLRTAGIARGLSNGMASAASLFGLVVLGATLFSHNSRVAEVLARFDATRDSRIDMWQDTWTAISTYWPVGSGIGTFTRTFLPVERLPMIDDQFPNRAHNDFLEFLLEAGLLAPLVLTIGFVVFAYLARKAWQVMPQERPVTLFSVGTFVVIALHSLVDYPLRNMALAVVAGVAAGLLGAIAREGREGRETNAT
ncbi:O-antigen ligase family protein [Erythrobacter mangrovi]|uniref:O-antigen ligase family protein n=1 Tax=Erythrobacter mangrovi TaxID=2739433 RepID=A0A7D3XIW5_9SPHN|nr:O-antigen ligase family protein [Erythrobacter mangrovi]QKG72453.1 O-antigen ligase family protein [Erythrobacter mangrovi]